MGRSSPAGGQRGPLGHPLRDVAEDPVALAADGQGSHLGFGVELVSDLDLGERAGEGVDEFVVTVLRHDDAGQRGAHLAGHHALGLGEPGGGDAEVGIVEDDGGGLAAEFEGDPGDPFAAQRGDPPAGRRRSGEGDLVDPRVAHQQLGHLAVGGDHVEDAGWQPDLLGDFSHQVALARCLR